MVWEIGVFFLSLFYAGILWFAYSNPANFIWPGIVFFAILFVAMKLITRRYFNFILPALLALGTILLLPLIDSRSQANAFALISAGIFYFAVLGSYRLAKYDKDKTAKAMGNLAAFAALFAWFASGYGWYLNIQMPIWLLMMIFAAVTFLVSYVAFRINGLELNGYQRVLYSVFLAYLIAGTVWIQNSWPFGYLTTGVITLIIYYSAWDLISTYFLQKLTIKRAIFNLSFMIGASALILVSARWYPVI